MKFTEIIFIIQLLLDLINNFEIAKLEEAGGTYLTVLDEAEVLENPNLPNRKRLFFILSSYPLFSLDSFQLSMNSLID